MLLRQTIQTTCTLWHLPTGFTSRTPLDLPSVHIYKVGCAFACNFVSAMTHVACSQATNLHRLKCNAGIHRFCFEPCPEQLSQLALQPAQAEVAGCDSSSANYEQCTCQAFSSTLFTNYWDTKLELGHSCGRGHQHAWRDCCISAAKLASSCRCAILLFMSDRNEWVISCI